VATKCTYQFHFRSLTSGQRDIRCREEPSASSAFPRHYIPLAVNHVA
jgi:hypothetical protein